MSARGIITIVGLLGLIWVTEVQTQADNAETETRTTGVRLDLQAEKSFPGLIVSCLTTALRAIGHDWSSEFVRGYVGSAFAIAMKPDGGRLVQADTHEWHHFYEMLDYFDYETVNATIHQDTGVSPEEHAQAKREGWNMVRRAIDDGYPAITWQAMTKEQRAAGGRLPWLWSLIVGYDEEAGTYDVHHVNTGDFTIAWDAYGHSDPVNWFYVMVFREQTKPFDALAANRRAIERAIETSTGMYPGVPTGGGHDNYPNAVATAHGHAAWEMWIDATKAGGLAAGDVEQHVRFLVPMRTAAVIYLTEVEVYLPERAHAPLREASLMYDDVIDALGDLGDLSASGLLDAPDATALIRKAYNAERAAVLKLQEVLDAI